MAEAEAEVKRSEETLEKRREELEALEKEAAEKRAELVELEKEKARAAAQVKHMIDRAAAAEAKEALATVARIRAGEETEDAVRNKEKAKGEMARAVAARKEAEDAATAAREDERRTRMRIAAMEAQGQSVEEEVQVGPRETDDAARHRAE